MAVLLLVTTGCAYGSGCSISAMPMKIGVYDPISRQPVDAYSNIDIRCEPGSTYRIQLDPGANAGSVFHPRKMRSLDDKSTLAYNLYTDSARTRVWGDGTGNTDIITGIGTGDEQAYVVYGRLSGGQSVPAGEYSDAVIVTVEW